jgi:predicted MFS family arabinose efflux permease
MNTWLPMIVIAMAQILLVFNVSTLQVSIEAIASSYGTPATSIGTAIVSYALVVAAFILLGGRVTPVFGSRRVFRWMVLLFGGAMTLVAISPGIVTMVIAQIAAGAAAAALVPTFVVLIVDSYRGRQQEKALGLLGGAFSLGIVLAFLIAGFLATWVHWRVTFAMLGALSVVIYKLGEKLSPMPTRPTVSIDKLGIVLVAVAIILISLGANALTEWGLLLARPLAPFNVLGMSPAPFMILAGALLLKAFVFWSRRLKSKGGTPLVALEVLETRKERSALITLFMISGIASGITFLIPMYIQVVQGRSSLETALAVIPFSFASLTAAVLVVRLYRRMSPSRIARFGFITVACGVGLLGFVVHNDWSDVMVVIGMILSGVGEGALMTLLFNVLVTASPKELAADVGSVRGVANNLATAVGTAVAGALVVMLLATSVHNHLTGNTTIPAALRQEVGVDNVSFVSNDRLREVLARSSATPEQVEEAIRINTDARLQALKVTFFVFSVIALLALLPARALPDYIPGDASRKPGDAPSDGKPPRLAAEQPSP